MAIHWQVKFRSLRENKLYTVNIHDDSYTGTTPVQLTGAASPLETQEDDNDDWFKPVRTQTGYLSIADTGKDNDDNIFKWLSLIPSCDGDRPVTVTDEDGNTVWRGYIQPQTFSGSKYESVQVREFPLMCALSVLRGVDVDTNVSGVVTFAYLLDKIITATGFGFYLKFQGTDPLYWLQKKIEWGNFVDVRQNSVKPKYTYFELLEHICTFFGWTCRVYGDSLYFVCPDEHFGNTFICIQSNDLSTIDSGTDPHYFTEPWLSENIDGDVYASTRNVVKILRGIRRASVTADINASETILEIPFGDISTKMAKNPPTGYLKRGDIYVFSKVDIPPDSVYKGVTVMWKGPEDQEFFPVRYQIYMEWDKPLKYLHNYSWNCWLPIEGSPSSLWVNTIRIKSKEYHNYENGLIYITGTIRSDSGEGRLLARLRIGHHYWNGSSWDTSPGEFAIKFGMEGDASATGSLPFYDTRQRNDPYPPYNGYGIPVTDVIGGEVEFDFCLGYLNGQHEGEISVNMESLRIGFVRHNSYSSLSEESTNVYKREVGLNFNGEKNVDTIFATDNNNAFGIGIIMEEDGSYCRSLPYNYSEGLKYQRPEECLLERICSRGQRTRMKETVELNVAKVKCTPSTFIYTGLMTGYPIAINRIWRDDIEKVTILQI